MPTTATKPDEKTAIELSDLLVKMTEDEPEPISRAAKKLREKLGMRSMRVVLDMLEGSATARAKQIGVSRQSYYAWINGRQRPNLKQAKKLEKLTGVPANEICFDR
jgi:DNA-binding XRE family transcriptional regulator